MTVQISVVLWTLICFALLYLILKFLLFRPLLAVMDRRTEKIENARRSAEQAAAARKLATEQAAAEREKQLEDLQEQIKNEAEEISREGKTLLEQARKERIETVTNYRAEMEKEYAVEVETAREKMQSVADDFLSCLSAGE